MKTEQEQIDIETLPPLFDQKVLAQAIGKSTKWCEQARLRGTGPTFKKLDGSIRYTRKDVLKWIEDCTRVNTNGASA